jgi:hypothetical protein
MYRITMRLGLPHVVRDALTLNAASVPNFGTNFPTLA